MFNLKAKVNEYYKEIFAEISEEPQLNLKSGCVGIDFAQELVKDYLRHSGYKQTLLALESQSKAPPITEINPVNKSNDLLNIKPQLSVVDIAAAPTSNMIEDQAGGDGSRKNSILTDKSDLTCKELDKNAYANQALFIR